MQKPLLVGESPSASGDRFYRFPLSGAPARDLCRAAGWEPDGPASDLGSWTWSLYGRFQTVNVFRRHREAVPWSAPLARERAFTIAVEYAPQTIVLLGRRVAAAFGVDGPWFEWTVRDLSGVRLVPIPHPSRRNLLMNDPAIRARVGETLRAACKPADT